MGVSMLLDMTASAAPDRTIVGSRTGGVTAEQFAAQVAGGARLLTETGASSVAFVGVNGPSFPLAIFAAASAGLPLSPLNYRLPDTALTDLVDRLDNPVLLADPAYRDAVAGTDRPIISTDEWPDLAAKADPLPPVDVDDESPAIVLYTSGTTSAPKGAVLRHSNLVSYVLQTVEFASAEPEEATLVTVPPYHIAGVGTVLSNIYAGRRLVYLPDFSPQGWLELVRAEQVTNAMVVPTMLARVVEHLNGAPAQLPSLRALAYGGARMPQPVLEAALEAMPSVAFANAYGLTETSSTIAILGPDDHRAALASDDPRVRDRLSSAGRLIPGVEGQVRDEYGDELPPGRAGQLWVRGPQVSGEYVGSGSLLDEDGWFDTRDQAWLDEDGYLFITGRTDDTIIKGGENIAPAEIEDVLVHHDDINEVAVVGVPDDEWGARIVAVVVRKPGATLQAEDVTAYARERLRGSRTPDEVVFREELPHTPTGKLLRRDLVTELTATQPAANG